MRGGLQWLGCAAASFCIFLMGATQAMAFSHYAPGTLGVKNGSAPPPGLWWENYNQYYTTDTVKDDNRSSVPGLGFGLDVYVNVTHLAWVTDKKILGADYGVDLFVPFVYTDLQTNAAGIDENSFGLGDIFIDPLILAWHGPRYDAFFAAGAYMPTGEHGDLTSPGKGYWTFMEQAGGTYYIDEARTWSASLRGRLEQSTEDPDTDITPGQELIFEYGLGKDIPVSNNLIMTLGAAGYSYWQITDDSGPGALDTNFSGHGLGPEIQFTFLKPFINIALRYVPEYQVKDSTQGQSFSLVLTGSF